ncbi:MAG: glycosyltransferase [Proteobacteria bacterium]|nr:glycosyltransferase [Pseudomonadota bacterium]
MISFPKISVIIPSFNREKTVVRAINSVLEQNYPNIELIVVDDGSSDNTGTILKKKYLKSIILLEQTNQGVSSARNRGVEQSSGKWIAFLDSDDYWHPKKLAYQIQALELLPDLKILQTQEIWIRNGKRVNPRIKHKKPKGWIFNKSLKLCCISPSSVLIEKVLFCNAGGFDEDLLACEDYDLWLRITANHPVGLVDQLLLTKTGGHQDQLSLKYAAMDRFRVYSLLKNLSISSLSQKQVLAAENQLDEKTEILVMGAKKRGRDITILKGLIREVRLKHNFFENRSLLKEALLSNW